MEAPSCSYQFSYCYCCLAKNEDIKLNLYTAENTLRSIFQLDQLVLCLICKRVAQQAEQFINNVRNNQVILDNFVNKSEWVLQNCKAFVQPFYKLSTTLPTSDDIISLTGTPEGEANQPGGSHPPFFGKLYEALQCDVKVVKQEINDDSSTSSSSGPPNRGNFEYPLEVSIEEGEIVGSRRGGTKRGAKHRSSAKVAAQTKVVHLSEKQVMEERAKKSKDRRYLDSAFKCDDCVKGFRTKITYDKHMESHNPDNGKYECPICKQRFQYKMQLTSHNDIHTLRYRCSRCDYMKSCSATVKDHFLLKHCNGHLAYSCRYCDARYRGRISLYRHIETKHKLKGRVNCPHCSKTYAAKDALRNHINLKHPEVVGYKEGPKNCVCDVCGMGFASPARLNYHRVKHITTKSFLCIECNKGFKTDRLLKEHLRLTSTHAPKNHVCQTCGKRFMTKKKMENHVNVIHLNYRPFQCDECGKGFLFRAMLVKHIRYTHKGYRKPRTIMCSVCDKLFDSNRTLENHMRTHTGETPFKCDKCPAAFKQSGSLYNHNKMVHLGLKRDGTSKTGQRKSRTEYLQI